MISKNKCMAIIVIIIIALSTANIVNASSFEFSAKAQKEIFNPGDEVIIDMNISNIDAGDEGINVVETSLEYDETVFESIEFQKQNDWKVEYNDIQGHVNQGKVLFVKMTSGVTNDEEIGKIKLKLRDDLGELETEIKLKQVTSNDGKELIPEGDRIIKIKIVKNQTQNTPNTTQDSNIDNDANMPKTGQARLVYIILAIVIIACIILLIYLKMRNKKEDKN